MKLYRTLLTPWLATIRSTRWIAAAGFVVFIAIDLLVRVFSNSQHPWLISAMVLGAGNGFCWAVFMPNTLLLALDAQRLCLPGIQREVTRSLALYALLSIGVPVLLQLPSGHALSLAIVLVLTAGIGAMYMLLPSYLGFGFFLLPALHDATRRFLPIPSPTDPGFVWWGAGGAVLMVLSFVLRWRQLLHGGIVITRGSGAPMLMNFRRSLSLSQSNPLAEGALLRARPDWLTTRPDLRHTGPQAPIKSLRMALGGVYLPQTVIGRLYRLFPLLVVLVIIGLLFVVSALGDRADWSLPQYIFSREGFIFTGLLFAVASMMVATMASDLLDLRWGKINAELPLLALLPGLGDARGVKRALLRTAIERPAAMLALPLIAIWIAAARLHLGWAIEACTLLISLGCLGLLAASAVSTLGGRLLPGWGKGLLLIGVFVLFGLSILLPMTWHELMPSVVTTAGLVLGVGWLALALFLLWLGRRGWRGLQQRPHPFLSNGSME